MTTRQGTKNPYAHKPTYGKDVCELMRRINALESKTIPRGLGWTLPEIEGPPTYFVCSTLNGQITYVVAAYYLDEFGPLRDRHEIHVYALDTSGESVSTVLWSSGAITDPTSTMEAYHYPIRPTWCCADGSGALWICALWKHDGDPDEIPTRLIKVSHSSTPPPGATTVSWMNPTGTNVQPLSTYQQGDGLRYKLLGYGATPPIGTSVPGSWQAFGKPVSGGGFELHSCVGYLDTRDGEHPLYQIETYSAGGVLTDFKAYSRPGASVWGHMAGATDDHFCFYEMNPDANDSGLYGIGHTLAARAACPELDLSDDYAKPGSTIKGRLIPPAPAGAVVGGAATVGGGGGFYGCVGFGGFQCMVTEATAGVTGNNQSAYASPVCCVARITSRYDTPTETWIHAIRYTHRLAMLGPSWRDPFKQFLSTNPEGHIVGLVPHEDEATRVARWRLAVSAEQTEWTAYLPNGETASLGTPDGGVDVPANNALVSAGAVPAPEHIIDMRNALLALVDDYFVAVFREPHSNGEFSSLEPCFAAWDYWGKWAGKWSAKGAWEDEPWGEAETVPDVVKPVVYVALAHAHSINRKYGLALEENATPYLSNPIPTLRMNKMYYRFRKSADTDMDETPMHDIDIGEVRALVDFLEDSYNNVLTFYGHSRNWIPWGNGENDGCPFGG